MTLNNGNTNDHRKANNDDDGKEHIDHNNESKHTNTDHNFDINDDEDEDHGTYHDNDNN